MTPEEEAESWARYQATGDLDARNRLVERYLGVVDEVVRRMRPRTPTLREEFTSDGMLGLLDAVERFDVSKGRFATYAAHVVRGAINEERRRASFVPRRIQDGAKSALRAVSVLEGRFGRAPTPEEVADELDVSVDQLRRMLQLGDESHLESLDATVMGQDATLGDTLAGSASRPEEEFDVEELRMRLSEAIAGLDERRRTVLSLLYRYELSHAQVSDLLGVAPSRVSQLKTEALWRILDTLAPCRPAPASAEYKRAIVAEYDATSHRNGKMKLLRREGLDKATLRLWRRAIEAQAAPRKPPGTSSTEYKRAILATAPAKSGPPTVASMTNPLERAAPQSRSHAADEPSRRQRDSWNDYKRSILEEYNSCTVLGGKKALLQREGLSASTVKYWNRKFGPRPRQFLTIPLDRPRQYHRTFAAEYKRAIVAEYDACTTPVAKRALMKREGLSGWHITSWRRSTTADASARTVEG